MMRQIIKGTAVSVAAACFLCGSSFAALAEESRFTETPTLEERSEKADAKGAETVINQCVFEPDTLVLGLAPGEPGGLPLLSLGLNILNEYYCIGNTVEVHH